MATFEGPLSRYLGRQIGNNELGDESCADIAKVEWPELYFLSLSTTSIMQPIMRLDLRDAD